MLEKVELILLLISGAAFGFIFGVDWASNRMLKSLSQGARHAGSGDFRP